MTLFHIAQSLMVGGVTGFLSGLLGVGGGFILIPLLTLLDVPIHTAIGTSAAFIVCTSLAGLVQHIRQHSVDFILAAVLTFPATVMARWGAELAKNFPASVLYLAFSILLLMVAIAFYLLSRQQTLHPHVVTAPTFDLLPHVLHRQSVVAEISYSYDVHVVKSLLVGFGAGILAGFFGVSGGFFLVPTLTLLLHVPIKITVGTCLALNVLPALTSTLTHWQAGNVDFGLWLPLVAASVLSSQFGARYMTHMQPEVIRGVFLSLVLAAALLMSVRGLSA